MLRDLAYYKKCLNAIVIGAALALFLTGDAKMFSMVYIMIAIFMIMRAMRVSAGFFVKTYMTAQYILIFTAQMYFLGDWIFDDTLPHYLKTIFRLLCISFAFVPLLVEKFTTVRKYISFRLPSLEELKVLSFAELKEGGERVTMLLERFGDIGRSLNAENLERILNDLPRHSSFKYVSNGNLTEEYFNRAYQSLDDPHLYLVISDTGSAASEVISVFTQKHFNHSSIAFDKDLNTIVSYNGGENVYPPGLNYEMVELFCKKEDSSILVYSIEASCEQKRMIIDKIKKINDEGSAYNLLGLILRRSYRPNIMFCSHFVYNMLQTAGLDYFEKDIYQIKPTDFIELDYYRKLKYEYRITVPAKNGRPVKVGADEL